MMPNETTDISYYVGILKKRIKLFIIPTVVVLVVTILVARLLPSVYQSSSTILIEEQQIPQEFVRSTVTGFADQRIQSLTQQILSRVKLWEIVQQFNLYEDMRKKYTREEVLEYMRDDIKLDTISAEVGGKKGDGQGWRYHCLLHLLSGKKPCYGAKSFGNVSLPLFRTESQVPGSPGPIHHSILGSGIKTIAGAHQKPGGSDHRLQRTA